MLHIPGILSKIHPCKLLYIRNQKVGVMRFRIQIQLRLGCHSLFIIKLLYDARHLSIEQYIQVCLKLRCAGGREFNPRPGQYSRIGFSSDQVTGKVFSSEHAFP